MATTLLYQSDDLSKVEQSTATLTQSLNIASLAATAATFLLAGWCRLRRSNAHSDQQRCRVVMIMSLSSSCYSISQLVLAAQPAYNTSQMVVRAAAFVGTLSVVFNSLLLVGSIGMDSAVRYGLRSFGLAQRLCGFSEIACFAGALVVSQPVLYLFDALTWTGTHIAVTSSQSAFEAAVWMTESAWVLLCLAMAIALSEYAIIKADKAGRYETNNAYASTASVLGTPIGIQRRVAVSFCYVLVFAVLYSWKLAFRASGSTSQWLLCALSICEPLQPMLTLVVFVADMAINMQSTDHTSWLSTSTICAPNVNSVKPVNHHTDCKSISSWRKTRFMEWQKGCKPPSTETLPIHNDVKLWVDQVNQCHIRSDFSHYEQNSCFKSDAP
ncbi:hypothetical protein IW141_005608, partial [Coemansia sp. RSA 355]